MATIFFKICVHVQPKGANGHLKGNEQKHFARHLFAVGLILLGLPIQLCTRTERAVRRIIVFLRL